MSRDRRMREGSSIAATKARAGQLSYAWDSHEPTAGRRGPLAARKKLVGQRVTLENQIRGLAVVSGSGSPCAHDDQALAVTERGRGSSHAAMRGLSAARVAVMTAVAAIDADVRRSTTFRPADSTCGTKVLGVDE